MCTETPGMPGTIALNVKHVKGGTQSFHSDIQNPTITKASLPVTPRIWPADPRNSA